MWISVLGWTLMVLGFQKWLGGAFPWTQWHQLRAEEQGLRRAFEAFREYREILESGHLPDSRHEQRLEALPEPWSGLATESLKSLRWNGVSLAPTLRRLEKASLRARERLERVRVRSAQSMGQAVLGLGLVPVFSWILWKMLPGLEEEGRTWLWITLGAWVWTLIGVSWMIRLGDRARWASLPLHRRSWLSGVSLLSESLLAWLRSGQPADRSWSEAWRHLRAHSPELAHSWGESLWQASEETPKGSKIEKRLLSAGGELKLALQSSLLEGRPVSERIELWAGALEGELGALLDQDLERLPQQLLKPLFLNLAPSVLGLLALGMVLSASQLL